MEEPMARSGGHISVSETLGSDRRSWYRFRTICPVRVESARQGIVYCIARNVAEGGIFLETREPFPIGTAVAVTFEAPNGATPVVARGCVKHHYFIRYSQHAQLKSMTGMGVRFESFEAVEQEEWPEWAFGVAPIPLH